MHFSQNAPIHASRFTRITAVGLFHVLVAFAIVGSMKIKVMPLPPFIPEPITEQVVPPTPPEPPPKFDVKPLAPPPLTEPVPVVEVQPPQVAPPPLQSLVQAQNLAADASSDSGGSVEAHVVRRDAVIANANDCEKPAYPASSAREGATGTVRLALLVGINGRVTQSRVEKSSGHRELDRAAQQALSLCRFKPATVDGVPEVAWAKLEYHWTLE
jgi:protein TonB